MHNTGFPHLVICLTNRLMTLAKYAFSEAEKADMKG
jgi:hypothetical protein